MMKINKLSVLVLPVVVLSLQSMTIHANQSRLPPAYLKVRGWEKCTQEKTISTWRSICLPNKKPALCLDSSWLKLQKTSKIPPC